MRPWLWLSPQLAHDLTPLALKLYGHFNPYQTLTWNPFTWRGLEFTNRLGLAGGVDKNADNIEHWWTLGPGFVEIGTVTPQPQTGHIGKRLARDHGQHSIWNRLGFPSHGMNHVVSRLQHLYQPRFTPVFANIGKNATTPLENAAQDYITCMEKLYPYVDAFVVNISSPNTAGLRELSRPENFEKFLSPIVLANNNRKGERISDVRLPLLIKLSPDISDTELESILHTSADMGIDGWILTNSSAELRQGLSFPKEGGVSGKPLAQRSKELLSRAVQSLGKKREDRLLISCGGVMSPFDVFERLELGADLVQVYSALIFNGPFFFRRVKEAAEVRT